MAVDLSVQVLGTPLDDLTTRCYVTELVTQDPSYYPYIQDTLQQRAMQVISDRYPDRKLFVVHGAIGYYKEEYEEQGNQLRHPCYIATMKSTIYRGIGGLERGY